MAKTLYIDLDGTILNISEKYYQVYKELGGKATKDMYWRAKRNGVGIDSQKPIRATMLESKKYLEYDIIFSGAIKAMVCFPSLVLVTLRKNQHTFREQLECLGLINIFSTVLRGADKFTAISSICSEGDILIGDSINDIQAANLLGIKSMAVTTGVRNREILSQYNPDYIIDDISELPKVLGG
jgi:beta-phosphoglucomutase-like phosphatase (HAD superfamily)